MSTDYLAMRILAVKSRVDMHHMYSAQFTADDRRRLAIASDLLADAPIYIDDSCSSILELRAKCEQLKRGKNGLDLVLVDYLELIGEQVCTENREQQRLDIMQSLKLLAKDLDIPVVIASQLKRALGNRSDKRPILSDFHKALWAEKYADVVMLIYRDKMHDGRKSNKEKTEIIIAKNSHGAVGSVELEFFHKSGVFESLGE